MWTEEKRQIIAGSKSVGLARIPRLVLKMWPERAVKLLEEVTDTIDSLNKEAKCTRPVFADPRSRG